MMRFRPNPGIMDIAPYVGGESKPANIHNGRIFKLSSNENPFGPSPLALKALSDPSLRLEQYPDGGSVELRAALAKKFDLEMDRLVCGAGSDELIGLLTKAYLLPGDEVIYSDHAFLMYGIYAKGCGARCIEIPEKNLIPDLEGMLAAVSDKTKIVFLTNPNNPTGQYNKAEDIFAFRDRLPPNILLVIDDAYAEYAAGAPDYENGFPLAKVREDVAVLRTFSKIYGLAGLRLGYGYFPLEVADTINRIRSPFNVTSMAQVAGLAALADDEFIEKSVAHTNHWRVWLQGNLEKIGLKVWPSAGNFLLVDFGTKELATRIYNALKGQGVLVRPMGAYKLPACLRISIGSEDAMIHTIHVLKNEF